MVDNLQKETKERQLRRKLYRRIYWMPIAVIILGLLSISLLMLTNQISERERRDFTLNDAVLDIRVMAGRFHLWLEEAVTGDETVDMKELWRDIDRAIDLSEAILSGGPHENGLILEPVKCPVRRKHAENLKSLLTSFRITGLRRAKDPAAAGIGSAQDQAFDAVYKEIEAEAGALENRIERERVTDETRARRLFWTVLVVWGCVVGGATGGLWNRERRRKDAENALERAKDKLEIQVTERTKELSDVNAHLQLELNERRKAEVELRKSEKQLRTLSSQLLTSQEKERKRIAAELHDELGGSLALLGIEFTLIEKKLNEGQTELRERCRCNLEHLDRITDNVSRLSRNLSPYLLEDLGLSAALRSLLNNFGKRMDIRMTLDIPEMNHLFQKDAEITIYRIIQESLTNIGKHARAQHVSVAIRIDDDRVGVIIEDNGKGFNVEQALRKDASERGMGLTTMEERVRMLGGSFDLWSQEGKGSRITFQIPIPA